MLCTSHTRLTYIYRTKPVGSLEFHKLQSSGATLDMHPHNRSVRPVMAPVLQGHLERLAERPVQLQDDLGLRVLLAAGSGSVPLLGGLAVG